MVHWYSHTWISIGTHQKLKKNKHNALLSSLMIMQLIQHQMITINMQYTFKQQCVHDYIQAECITFHINNPVKLVTYGRKPCLPIYPQLVYLNTKTQLYKFNISSPNRDPCVAKSWSCIMYHLAVSELEYLVWVTFSAISIPML